jgi:predicted ribosomally synthesized peptide with nif11-like leader
MSEDQLKAFLEAVKADAALQKQLYAATDPDSVVSLAKAEGFIFSVESLMQTQYEVSDEELEGVAGGTTFCIGVMCGTLITGSIDCDL